MMTETAVQTAKTLRAPPAGRSWLVWVRPQLPSMHRGSGLAAGNILIVLGFAAIIVPPVMVSVDYGAGGMAAALLMGLPFGGVLITLGIVTISVCLILREIRQAAYEAALRAGEVETRTRG